MSYAPKLVSSSLGHDHGGYSDELLRRRQAKNRQTKKQTDQTIRNSKIQDLKHQSLQVHAGRVKIVPKPVPEKKHPQERTSMMNDSDGSEETIETKVHRIKEKVNKLTLNDQLARNASSRPLSVSRSVNHPIAVDVRVAHQLFFVEEDIRELVQEEKSMNVDIATEPRNLTLSFRARMSRFNSLHKRYWYLQQKWWHYYSCFSADQRSKFDLWRSDPKWYMHDLLVKDCAGRNGCCARGCGCCAVREPSSKRPLGAGHCTFECSCCREARGFDFPSEERKLFKKKCREEILSLLEHRIVRVAIWGLVDGADVGVDDDSFDMVSADEP